MSQSFAAEPVRIRVPATSANLGPGFDSFGLALGWYDEVTARVTDFGLDVIVQGEGAGGLSLDETHLVVRAMRRGFAKYGAQPPGLAVDCVNRIPHGRGLGSSAAAIVAGVLAARALSRPGDTPGERFGGNETDLTLAAEVEGHPDNVAACLLGGFTVAWTETGPKRTGRSTGRAAAVRLEPAAAIRPLALVPNQELATEQARALLPASVPHRDAAHTAARAALLVYALTARPDLLLSATDDRLHQPYRAPAMPDSHALLTDLRDAGVPAVISGAGPAVLTLAGSEQADLITAMVTERGWSIHDCDLDRDGARGVRLGRSRQD
ncbi:MAG TPA: homoserine kinase [Actinomycetes bacterium]|nr:homoserine kinase [Actinomycetes bacterium]